MNTQFLTARLFADMLCGGTANLDRNRSTVNDLNVFPIPDGDTGDNMFMTAEAGSRAAADCGEDTLGALSSRISKGMLLGARGNSGVILSRIFAGIAQGFCGLDRADVRAVSSAFADGVAEAYRAVSVPVEGTILTVCKDAVRFASDRLTAQSSLESFFDDYLAEMKRSLDRTPELLAVLREAGVVDSGGAGLVFLTDGMRQVLCGGKVQLDAPERTTQPAADLSLFGEDSKLEYGYCTEFLLRLQNSKVDVGHFDEQPLLNWLNANGDSVVAFRDGSILKVHIHTRTPGDILNQMQKYGEFLTLKIENMTLQHSNTTVRSSAPVKPPRPHKAYATVAVAAGQGMKDTLLSLGTDAVVDGGQSMNPSAGAFLDAFASLNADTILVFPNNGNILLTAQQAAGLYEKADIRVVPTRTVGEGYCALSMLDTSCKDTDAIVRELTDIAKSVVTGMVSTASRDTEQNGIRIRTGDFIGFADDAIYTAAANAEDAAEALAGSLHTEQYDVAILICGQNTAAERAQALYDRLSTAYRRTEFIMLDGGQPIYDYILILE